MLLASFNVENMFERPRAMNKKTWKDGQSALDDYYTLNTLIEQPIYSPADKANMTKIMKRYKGLMTRNKVSKLIRLRDIRGQFLKFPKGKPVEIVATGRDSWIGWFELVEEEIKEVATENTARVFKEVQADVIAVIECDNRIALKKFNEFVIRKIGYQSYGSVMLIDGNDDRGIDVGLLCSKGYEIDYMRSHVDDVIKNTDKLVFSRDCPEYFINTPSGQTVLLLVNHFKSKGHGTKDSSDQKRTDQAKKVREIYDQRKAEGFQFIAVLGDLNDTPDSAPLAPLLADNELRDFSEHPNFSNDGHPGTYGDGHKSDKFDYILLSPALYAKLNKGGVMRKGVWGGTNGTLWPHFATMNSAKDAASDHAAVWVDLSI